MRGRSAERSGCKIPDLPDDFVNRGPERRPANAGSARITLTKIDNASDHRARVAGTDWVPSGARVFRIRQRRRSGGCTTAGVTRLYSK